MAELSIFADESGDIGSESKYYLISLVLHDQSSPIAESVKAYETSLGDKRLTDIPAHLGPLLNGHGDYENQNIETRKQRLGAFRIFVQHCPFRYRTFSYLKRECGNDVGIIEKRMKRDLTDFLFDNLGYFQSFDRIKVYYDNGQPTVTKVLRDAIRYVLGKNATVFKDASPQRYRLSQVADYACGIELIALKYAAGERSTTERLFFGESTNFKKNWLKKLRKNLI